MRIPELILFLFWLEKGIKKCLERAMFGVNWPGCNLLDGWPLHIILFLCISLFLTLKWECWVRLLNSLLVLTFNKSKRVFGIMRLIWHNCQQKSIMILATEIMHNFNDTFISMMLCWWSRYSSIYSNSWEN